MSPSISQLQASVLRCKKRGLVISGSRYSEMTVLPLKVKTLGLYGHAISRYQAVVFDMLTMYWILPGDRTVLSNLPCSKNCPVGYNCPVSSGSGWLLLSGTVLQHGRGRRTHCIYILDISGHSIGHVLRIIPYWELQIIQYCSDYNTAREFNVYNIHILLCSKKYLSIYRY